MFIVRRRTGFYLIKRVLQFRAMNRSERHSAFRSLGPRARGLWSLGAKRMLGFTKVPGV